MEQIRVLMTSAGEGPGINFARSLRQCARRYHIIGTETNVYRTFNIDADEVYLLPPANDPVYWPALLQLIEQTKPDFLYAADTNLELATISERRHELPTTCLPDPDKVIVFEDKWKTNCRLREVGIKVPDTILVESQADLDLAFGRFGRVWLRATQGSGGRASLPTDDPDLARCWINRHKGWGHFTAAEVLTSRMATWIGLWWRGQLVVCQARKRLFWEFAALSPSGVTGVTGAQSTTSDKVIHETALRAIRAIDPSPHGIVSVDFTYDKRGIPNPTEIQASRFYSSIHFLTAAGLNLPDLYVRLGLTGVVPNLDERENPLPDDLVWIKYVDCLPRLTNIAEVHAIEADLRRRLLATQSRAA